MFEQWTYSDVLDKKCTSKQFFDQFSDDDFLIGYVGAKIGEDRIKNSACKYFNDIPLREWENCAKLCQAASFLPVGDRCLAFQICLVKSAARRIKSQA